MGKKQTEKVQAIDLQSVIDNAADTTADKIIKELKTKIPERK